MRLHVIAALLALATGPALAQTAPSPPAVTVAPLETKPGENLMMMTVFMRHD